jgi:hypothetical protein
MCAAYSEVAAYCLSCLGAKRHYAAFTSLATANNRSTVLYVNIGKHELGAFSCTHSGFNHKAHYGFVAFVA